MSAKPHLLVPSAKKSRAGKNIVLCADGTGNLGGETPDSNVYKVYKIVEMYDSGCEQVKFYDNGIGTHKNKYMRAMAGAIGGGFRQNVLDLYEFLARSYEPGDRIFIFGFSRGAATVRAFSGMLATCGLIDGSDLTEQEMRGRLAEVFEAYKQARAYGNGLPAERLRQVREGVSHGVVTVEMIGVWDTVAALGLPQDFRILGLLIWCVNAFFYLGEKLLDFFAPHRFYDFELTENVRHAYHAIAIDDERLTFAPMIWDEHRSPGTDVEQVWFAGAHSNVGGGYGRTGLAGVSLCWMMARAMERGLRFEEGSLLEARNGSNVHGRLFDARDGLGVFYRYEPRDIEGLSRDRLRGPIKIHRSVLERLERRTANYAPSLLPASFDVVEDDPAAAPLRLELTQEARPWQGLKQAVRKWTGRRGLLYNAFLEISIWISLVGFYFVAAPPPAPQIEKGSFEYWMWQGIDFFLPATLENLAGNLLHRWYLLLGVGLVGLGLVALMRKFRRCETLARESARRAARKAWQARPEELETAAA